jgi:hypothetical protein
LKQETPEYSTAKEDDRQRRMTGQTDQHHADDMRSAIIETSSFRTEIERHGWGYETTVRKALLHMYGQCA